MKKPLKLACPHCGHDLDPKFIRKLSGRLLGSISGKRKAHSSAVARKAAMARWSKREEPVAVALDSSSGRESAAEPRRKRK